MKKLLLFITISALWIGLCIGLYKFGYKQPEVVKLMVISRYDDKWEGTGVFVRDDLIMTAGHVIGNAQTIKIQWPDGTIRLAYDWYEESETDLGIITVRTLQKEQKARFDNAKIGEDVWAIGNPFGAFPIMTKGIVSAVDMPDDYTHQKNMIIADTAINPGNSGSALFNKSHKILGICSWGYNCSQGMSYFIRAEVCKLTIDKYDAVMKLKEID